MGDTKSITIIDYVYTVPFVVGVCSEKANEKVLFVTFVVMIETPVKPFLLTLYVLCLPSY